jgi:polyisoprenoid-binding protein YceI
MFKQFIGLFAIVFFIAANALGAGKCEFFAKADVGILEFTGTGCVITGTPKLDGGKVSGEFSVDMTKLDAGIRNEHMHDKSLETKKFPKATLKLDAMPEAGGEFSGKLTLHGIEKPIKGKAEKTASGWSFKFDIKTSDFGIKKAGYKGIEIGENISISGSIDRQ